MSRKRRSLLGELTVEVPQRSPLQKQLAPDVNQERNFLAELHYWGIDHAPNQRKDYVGPAVNLNNQIWQNDPSNHHVITGKAERVNMG